MFRIIWTMHCWCAEGTWCSQKADLAEGFSVTQPLWESNTFWWRLFLFIPFFYIWSYYLQVKVDEGKTIYFICWFFQQCKDIFCMLSYRITSWRTYFIRLFWALLIIIHLNCQGQTVWQWSDPWSDSVMDIKCQKPTV